MCSDITVRDAGIMISTAWRLNLGKRKFGIANQVSLLSEVKSTIPIASAATYPTMMEMRMAIAEAKPLRRTCPKTAISRVIRKTITNFGFMWVYVSVRTIPPFWAAFPASSRPIRATTGPIAAGGSTTSIHFTPTNFTRTATDMKMIPVITNPPRAY